MLRNNNRVLFTGNLTAEPELNYPPKGTAVVNASLANNEFYTFEGGERQQITKVLHAGPRASRVAMRAHNHKIPFSPCRYLNLLDLHRLETLAEWTGKAAALVSLCGQATPPLIRGFGCLRHRVWNTPS